VGRTSGGRIDARAVWDDPVVVLFGGAIALSAFLLFSIQPLIGQIVLPVFGGTPAAWATVLVFFQLAVLLGYGYSHLSVTRLGPRRGAFVHIVLAGAALGWLVIVPLRPDVARPGDLIEALDVLRILLISVGPPVAVLTATTPLISAWFVATRARAGAQPTPDPYWLYALSNAASLGALLAYPLVIGPLLGLSAQGRLWTLAFAVLCGLLVIAASVALRRAAPMAAVERTPVEGARVEGPPVERTPDRETRNRAAQERVNWRRRATWVLLAAVPSGLLAAVTNFIASDLIAAPLLWIGPLSLYLGSFIVAFSERGRRIVPTALLLAPAAITLLWTPLGSAGGWPILPLIVLEWSALAIVATALHGRLADDRPAPSRLTEFYLVQSIGGVLGGAFVALVAPLAFDGIWEYPILLVLALVAMAVTEPTSAPAAPQLPARPGLNLRPFFRGASSRLAPYLIIAGLLTLLMAFERSIAFPVAVRWFAVGGLILLVGGARPFLALATALVLVLATFVLPSPALFRDRSFFGVTEVARSVDGHYVELFHGTTVHGKQALDPMEHRKPTFYYARSGPLGDVFEAVNARRHDAAIGITGMGAGGIAAYLEAGQTMTFFEIDPVVVRVASDPQLFTYLAEAPVPPRVVLGDARLSLREEATGTYDALILDAFSSDAIPAHLITLEALREDIRVLRPDGLLVVHVSNRYYDLSPAIGAAGAELGLAVLERRYSPTDAEGRAGAAPSIWLIATGDAAMAEWFRSAGWTVPNDVGVEPLTDDHPDVLRFLRWFGG
jgi:hypothetical protein